MSIQPNFHASTLAEFLTIERTIFKAAASSKKRAIELISGTIATSIPQLTESTLYENFLQREKLGSTALGKGFALPHCRSKEIEHVVGCFLLSQNQIDFDADDKQPIDMLFALVVPMETTELHLQILAFIAEKFSENSFTQKLRNAGSQEELFKILTSASS